MYATPAAFAAISLSFILPTAPCSRYGRSSSSTTIARLRPLPVLEEAGRDGVAWERVTRPHPRPVGVLLVCWRFIVMKRPSGFLGRVSLGGFGALGLGIGSIVGLTVHRAVLPIVSSRWCNDSIQ
ncbi:hypothetical protein CI102_13483 [Trichoderma harzianum]|nr:hypothetical protein CI102_13483 [Trichoderma harzianum]